MPPFGPPGGATMPDARASGSVVMFQVLGYEGTSDMLSAARQALTGIPWVDPGRIEMDQGTATLIVGLRGASFDTGAAKTALQQAGFRIVPSLGVGGRGSRSRGFVYPAAGIRLGYPAPNKKSLVPRPPFFSARALVSIIVCLRKQDGSRLRGERDFRPETNREVNYERRPPRSQ
jgi:hypothetical protein